MVTFDRRAGLHGERRRLGDRQRLPLSALLDRDALLDARQEIPQRSGQFFAGGDRFPARLEAAVEQVAAHRAVLDVGALVHPEESQCRLLLDAVAFDQAFDLGAGDARELAFIGIERTQARRV